MTGNYFDYKNILYSQSMATNKFCTFIKKLIQIGIYEDTPEDDRETITLFNKFALVIGVLSAFLTVQDFLLGSFISVGIDIICIIIISSGFLLNYFRLHRIAKVWFMVIHPLIVVIIMLTYGDSLRSSYSFILFFTCVLLLFNQAKIISILIAYVILLWFSIEYYLLKYPPLLPNFEGTLLDKIAAPSATLLGIYLIVCNYKKKVKSKEKSLRIALENTQIQNEKLNTANAELERFAFATSHDLKTPVRAIVSFLNLIEIKIKKQEYADLEHYIGFAKDGGLQINRLISEILEFSKLNINQTLERTEIDLDAIFSKNTTNLQGYILEKNAKVESGILGKITSNELFVGLLFQNLLENAIKFNKKEQPLVKVTAKKTEKGTSISFQDNGIGIEKEFYESIFHIFNRLHNQQDYAGTGMGLAICKKIMERLGGTISLTSEIGVGTTFILFFPK